MVNGRKGNNVREIDKLGFHTIQYAIEELLSEAEGEQFHLTPHTFAKYMKRVPVHDSNHKLKRLERKRYKNQLKKINEFWDNEEHEWSVEESGAMNYKLIFRRK